MWERNPSTVQLPDIRERQSAVLMYLCHAYLPPYLQQCQCTKCICQIISSIWGFVISTTYMFGKKYKKSLSANTGFCDTSVRKGKVANSLIVMVWNLGFGKDYYKSLQRGNSKLKKEGVSHLARWTAVAAPIPLLAPVTRATFPRSDIARTLKRTRI